MLDFIKKNQQGVLMSKPSAEEKKIIESLRALPPDKKTEVIDFIEFLKTKTAGTERRSLKSLWGRYSVHISDRDISNLRKEMWGNFPSGNEK
ncbi:DUF2281 domain-containing protein [Geoalkalibacter halelectricus]|uniref:DUF2281 domain-containing protein n=1 Tax=Geoalkalibacter halelectricus TaxID=2847045 RepID=A0ABY5ZLK2_9BACT|nr:DUF2281 domain-containing protein [Geoalkalibacter halelectricus]MDO3379763.1 DUF2281 domain-containing protein [Geoalkalibacter halelectricus]UWZ79586.1 DUF2281 domain-containing protein [Geoalkalibacter halelectricus]